MFRFAAQKNDFACSTSSRTPLYPLYMTTGATKGAQVYDVTCACSTASQDVLVTCQYVFFTTAGTPGTGITPISLEQGAAPSAVTGVTFTPTPGTASAVVPLNLTFNGRVTVRWVAPDPDGRICLAAGGSTTGGVGSLSVQQVGTATFNTDNWLAFAE